MRGKYFALAAAVACVASPLSAQDLSITPFIGTVIPLNNMIMDTAGGTYYKQGAHTTYGLRLSKQMSPGLALQLQGGIGRGEFEVVSAGTPYLLKSSLWFADLRARFRILGSDATNLGLLAGAGWTQYKNGLVDTAHEQDEETSLAGRVTGIVGLGVKAHLMGDVSFTADLTDRIHEQPFESAFLTDALIQPLQHDLSMSFGLNFPLGN